MRRHQETPTVGAGCRGNRSWNFRVPPPDFRGGRGAGGSVDHQVPMISSVVPRKDAAGLGQLLGRGARRPHPPPCGARNASGTLRDGSASPQGLALRLFIRPLLPLLSSL